MSERRAQRRRGLAAPVLRFDLREKLKELRSQPGYADSDHSAVTLLKEPDLRIVLVALKPGGRLKDHQADARISIQVLEGRVQMRLPTDAVELGPGELLALEPDIPHDVEGLEESAFLLTIAWTGHASAGAADPTPANG